MKTIAENVKFPEFKEQYKGAAITGHLVKIGEMYYFHAKRVVTEMTYDELPDFLKVAVAEYNEKMEGMAAEMAEMRRQLRARRALIEWAEANAYEAVRSNQSESMYYYVRDNKGNGYKVRVSGHRYPTGSMTDLMFGHIDTTDLNCSRFCDMLGIEY